MAININKEKSFNLIMFEWILQVIIWINTYLFIMYGLFNYIFELWVIILYLIYLILNISDSNFKFIGNIIIIEEFYKYIQSLYTNPVKIVFTAISSHDTYKINSRNIKSEEVVTSSIKKEFVYYSWRDVSGRFTFPKTPFEKNIRFLKIKLNLNIEYADEISYFDHEKMRKDITTENKNKDSNFKLTEKFLIDDKDLKNYLMISICDKPFGISSKLYIILTFLTFVQIYKIYINYFCIYKENTIRKVISSRYKLNTQESTRLYYSYRPRLCKLNTGEEILVEDSYGNFDNHSVCIPSELELKSARELVKSNQVIINKFIFDEDEETSATPFM